MAKPSKSGSFYILTVLNGGSRGPLATCKESSDSSNTAGNFFSTVVLTNCSRSLLLSSDAASPSAYYYSIAEAEGGSMAGLQDESYWFAALMPSKKPVSNSYWLLLPEKVIKSLC